MPPGASVSSSPSKFADHGFDLLINAEDSDVRSAAARLSAAGVGVQAVQTDLRTYDGVEQVYAAIVARGGP